MRRADQVAGIALLVFALWFTAAARRYPYWGENGPGSGFLPFWVGLAMAALAALLLVGAVRPGPAGARWLPEGRGLWRLAAVSAVTVLFVAAIDWTGMILGTALFLFVVLRFVERYSWARSVGVAAGAAVGVYLLFVRWLGVFFPVGPLGF
jgi:putative tricarboxylic transport membrane protein